MCKIAASVVGPLLLPAIALDVYLSERALAAFGVVIDMLKRGQTEGILRKRNVRGHATACWAQMHAMLTIDGLLLPEKVGPKPLDATLMTLLEGLEN